MRNISHYVQKLSTSTSLSDIERYVKGARLQVQNDLESIQKKRNQLLDKVKLLDQESAKLPTIQKEIDALAKEKFIEIMSLSTKPKRTYKKKQAIEKPRQPERKKLK